MCIGPVQCTNDDPGHARLIPVLYFYCETQHHYRVHFVVGAGAVDADGAGAGADGVGTNVWQLKRYHQGMVYLGRVVRQLGEYRCHLYRIWFFDRSHRQRLHSK